MDQFLTFAGNNWELFLALGVILVLLYFNLAGQALRGYRRASPTEATQLMNRENAVVVDVREDNEFKQGHILGAVHVPLGFLDKRINDLEQYKDRPVIVSCRSGQRSARAASVLKKHGFESVYNLEGGLQAWQNASMPVTKK